MNHIEYLLTCLNEECSEVIKAGAKAQRFGLFDKKPGGDTSNAEDIVTEFYQAYAVMEMLAEEGVIDPHNTRAIVEEKKRRVREFMLISERLGTLTIAKEQER